MPTTSKPYDDSQTHEQEDDGRIQLQKLTQKSVVDSIKQLNLSKQVDNSLIM